MAGKRKGKEDERHLWPEMLRVIREVAPKYIVGENVLGLVNWDGGLVFAEVQADLESAGYEVATVVIPAAAVNAPHGRDRVWFVAYRNNTRNTTPRCGIERNRTEESEEREYPQPQFDGHGVDGLTADAHSNGQHQRNGYDEINASEGREYALGYIGKGDDDGNATDTTSTRRGKDNWERKSRFNDQKSSPNDWDNFPTQSPICGGDDGLPRELDGITFSKWRNESIRAYGNAIVPNVAFEIFKVIQIIETQP